MTPLYVGSGAHSLFAWLHSPPAGERSEVGLVLCKPFGYEAICAHASLRIFADAAAATGATVLRFDYSGTGDSSGGESDREQIGPWTDDVVAAIEAVRRVAGVRRVCLLGVRLGAMLAALAAERCAVDGLIAVAPVADGRRYLRELRTFQAAAAGGADAAPTHGGLEVTGFTLSAATVDVLSRLNLQKSTRLLAPRLLIVDRSDFPCAKPWADAQGGMGTDAVYRCLPGFAEMVSTPHSSQPPQEMIDAAVEWLTGFQLATELGRTRAEETPAPLPDAVMGLTSENGTALEERAAFIDAGRTLFAVVTTPAAPATTHYGVLMLNGGATSHIGPNRMYVELARRWAARGYVVLRLDLAGLGDSATRPGRRFNEVYPLEALDDIATAINYLRIQHRVDNITLAGLCAGAYHALTSATAGLPVDTVLLVNPLTFYWKQGSQLNDLQMHEVIRNPGIYAQRVMAGKAWLKLLRGRVNLMRVAKVLMRRAWLTLESNLRDLARLLRIRIGDDLGWDLQSVTARGVRIVFLFARGDGGATLLKVQGGSAVAAIGDRCRIHMIDGADHIFSQSAPREKLVQLLSSELPI